MIRGKAAIYEGPGLSMKIKEFPLPEVDPDAVLIKISLANICGSDIHIWKGERKRSVLPTILGHEMTGTVYHLGKNVHTDSTGKPLSEGDRVVYSYMKPCFRCPTCLKGQSYACPFRYPLVGAISPDTPPHFIGAFAEYYYLIPGLAIFKVPDVLSNEEVSPINCALSQAVFSLHRIDIHLGDVVAIQGAGGLGLNTIAVAKEMGAGTIIAIDGVEERLMLAKEFGAAYTININNFRTREERLEQVMQITNGNLADVVVEATGNPGVISEGIEMLRYGGRYLILGSILIDRSTELAPGSMIRKNLTLKFVGYYEPWAMSKGLELLVRTKSKYPFGKIVSHKFRLEQINEAFKFADRGTSIRVAIEM